MNDFAFEQDAARYRSTVDTGWVTYVELGPFLGISIGSFEVESFARRSTYGNRVRLAKARRRLDQPVQHRLQVEGGPADDLEHVGGRGLLLQRFAQVGRALAQFPQQSCVLNCDHRLFG